MPSPDAETQLFDGVRSLQRGTAGVTDPFPTAIRLPDGINSPDHDSDPFLSADGLTAQTRRGCGSRARRCSRGVGVQALSARTLARYKAKGGTGAKGTVLPAIVAALCLLALWGWWRSRRLPGNALIAAGLSLAAFAVVYVPAMSAWLQPVFWWMSADSYSLVNR